MIFLRMFVALSRCLGLTYVANSRSGQPHNVLTEAVYTYMNAVGEGLHEDFMRAFFRLRINDIGSLLPHVAEVLRGSAHEVTHSLSETIPQANDTLLVCIPYGSEKTRAHAFTDDHSKWLP